MGPPRRGGVQSDAKPKSPGKGTKLDGAEQGGPVSLLDVGRLGGAVSDLSSKAHSTQFAGFLSSFGGAKERQFRGNHLMARSMISAQPSLCVVEGLQEQ